MLIRVAIAVHNKIVAQKLTNRIVSFSMRRSSSEEDIEFDFSYYDNLSKLLKRSRNVDMSIISFEILEGNQDILASFHRSNPVMFSVPFGLPDEKVCEFLALRPAGHLRNPDDQNQIDRLCTWCAEGMMGSTDILQIKTRQGCYAITASSILFCQSDQKYVMIVTETGEIFRKLEKLEQLVLTLPDYFVRVHQSFLVNSHRISGLDKTSWEILLDSGNRIPVSRAYQKTIAEQIQKFLYNYKK